MIGEGLKWKSYDGYSRDFDDLMAVESMAAPEDIRTVRDGVPMKINIQTQAIMDMNIKTLEIKEVKNQSSFEGGRNFTEDGLYSYIIFGATPDDRKKTWGYIDLHTTVIHPYIYETLTKLQHNITDLCSGSGSWKITDSPKKNELSNLVKVNPDDPDYDPNNTGMEWFITNYPKIKFLRNNSRMRSEKIDLLETFAPGEIFIHTWMVMPVFLRDVELRDGPPKKPEVTKMYEDLLRYSIALSRNSGFAFESNMARYNIQNKLVEIYKYFRNLIMKSDGFFHQYVLGKSPDYGARSVISCAVLDQYDKPNDDPIDLCHTGIPLAQICSMLYPFISRWVYNYLENLFVSNPTVYVGEGKPGNPGTDNHGSRNAVEFDDPMKDYDTVSIQTKINHWLNTYEDRFEPVTVNCKDGVRRPIVFTGRPYSSDPDNVAASTISKRCLTWTDILYMAAEECCNGKVVWSTRYPITNIQNTIPTEIHVMSTVKTLPVLMEGKIYPYYPMIDPKLPKNIIERSFNDTVNMSNTCLEGMNGDYDGDTVSMRIPFLVDSNEESLEIMRSLKNYLNAQGAMLRNVSNEAHFMLYNLTREDPSAPWADDITKGKFLAMDANEIGIKKLTELFGTRYNKSTKKFIDPPYKVTTRVHLKAGELSNTSDVDTTLGRIIFNKIMLMPYVSSVLPGGYVNDEMVSKKIGGLFQTIGRAAMYNKISTDSLWPFLKAFEFYTTKGVTIFAPSYSSNMIVPKKELLAEKEKFFKDNPNPTIDEMVKMEDALVKKATSVLEKDPSYPLFASDARGSVAGNYKSMDLFIGPVQNPVTGEWDRIESDFISGFKKNEIATAGNMLINGQYPKSCGTAVSGYITKQFNAVFQSVVVDEDGTDCGTKSYITVKLTDKNWILYEFQNIIDDSGKLVVLTEDTKSKFIGKTVKMRSPMCCTANTLCSACVGRRPYIMQIRNIGLQFSELSNDLLNKGMKAFHDAKVSLDEVDPDRLLI